MASSSFVPLPFFTDESGGEDKKKNDFNGFGSAAPVAFNPATSFGGSDDKQELPKQFSEPSSTQLPTDFFSSSFTASSTCFTAPSNIAAAVPVPSFTSNGFGSSAVNGVNVPAAEPAQAARPNFNSAEPVPQLTEPAVPVGFTGFNPQSSTVESVTGASFGPSWPAAQPSQQFVPEAPKQHDLAPSFASGEPSLVPDAPKQSEPWASVSSFAQPSVEPSREPWAQNQAIETATFVPKVAEPSQVSWQTSLPSAPRRSSIDSQHSNPPNITFNTSVSAPPSIALPPYHHGLDALEETLSTRSFTNSSFVIEGGKACDRCSKQNELTANFCCRCGAQIGSPIESPSDSGVFSVDSSSPVFEQMASLSISEKSFEQQTQPFAQPSQFTASYQPSTCPPCTYQPKPSEQVNQSVTYQPQPQLQPQFAPQTAVVSPTKPAAPSRVHPVMTFGFGGSFVMTFPTLQTRYNPNGQPINSYRPSMVYKGDLEMLPQAKAKMREAILAIDNGAPLLEKAQKPKELSALISILKSSPVSSGDKLLFGMFELILKSSGKPLDNPHVLDNLKEVLADALSSEHQQSSLQSSHGSFGLNEVGQKVISGDIVGASESATSHQLWSHALLLGQFAGAQHYQKVVTQFVQQDFPPSHPVRLVYLMLSGQSQLIGQEFAAAGPALSKSWASTLLALVSNRKSPIDNALLISLGDVLSRCNDISSAQFCYLLSQDETIFSSGRVKSIGSGDFVNMLRMTEAYEAVRYSMNPSFCLPHLFPLKMTFVSMLLELGLNSLALRHCNALGSLLKKSQWKDAIFLEAFDSLVNRLEVFAEGNPSIVVPCATEGSGWFPKVGGLMDVLDRVIGVEDSGKSSPSKKSLKSPILAQVDVAAEPASNPSYQAPVGGFDPFGSTRGSFSAAPWEQVPRPVAPIKDATEAYIQKHEQVEAVSFADVPGPALLKPEQPRNQAWSPTPEGPLAWQSAELKQAEPIQPWQQSNPQPFGQPIAQHTSFGQSMSQLASQPTGSAAWHPAGQMNSWEGAPNQFGGQNQSWEAKAQSQYEPPQLSQSNQAPFAIPAPMNVPPPQNAPPSPHLMHQASMPNLPSAADTNTASTSVDDFGFANAPAVKRSETPTGTAKAADIPDPDSNKDSDSGSKSSLLGGFLGGFFKRKQNASSPALSSGSAGSAGSNGPVKANLGESEMKLVYDEVKKQWVRKDTGAPPVAQAAAPPPPPSMGAQSNSSDSGSPMSYRRGQVGGPRGKYVDAFGADATTPAPSAPRVNLIPTPSFTNHSLEQPIPNQQEQPAGQPQIGQMDQPYQGHAQSQPIQSQYNESYQGQPPQNPQPMFNVPQYHGQQLQGQPPGNTQYQGSPPPQHMQDQPQQQSHNWGQSSQTFNPQEQPPQQQNPQHHQQHQQQQQYSYGAFNPTGPSGVPFYQQ